MLAIFGAHFFVFANNSAAGIGAVNLYVKIITVTQHQKSVIAAEFSVHFLTEEHHRIGLSGALRVPKDTKLAIRALPVFK